MIKQRSIKKTQSPYQQSTHYQVLLSRRIHTLRSSSSAAKNQYRFLLRLTGFSSFRASGLGTCVLAIDKEKAVHLLIVDFSFRRLGRAIRLR
jgi:hypothetical protein